MTRNLLATWLVIDQDKDASLFPQVGLNSATPEFQAVYWRCVACFYATSHRLNPDVAHAFYTNAETLPVLDGFDLGTFLSRLGVEVRHLPITHRLGRDRVKAWNNQFYILDILKDLAGRDDYDGVVVLDSDCAWVRPATEFFADVQRRGILSLSIPYADDFKVNEGSRLDMKEAAFTLAGRKLDFVPHYSGGELFAATRDKVREVVELTEVMWDRLVSLPSGSVGVYEEAHFLSIAYELLDVPAGTADPHTRRMWTALRLNNVTAEDVDSARCVWHLPMEKKTGFRDLFDVLKDDAGWFWTVPPATLRLRIAEVMGLPRKSMRQVLLQARSRASFYASKWRSSMRASPPAAA